MSVDILSRQSLTTLGSSLYSFPTTTSSTSVPTITRVPQQTTSIPPILFMPLNEETNQNNEKIVKLFKKIYNNLDDIDKAIIKSKLTEEELELLDCL